MEAPVSFEWSESRARKGLYEGRGEGRWQRVKALPHGIFVEGRLSPDISRAKRGIVQESVSRGEISLFVCDFMCTLISFSHLSRGETISVVHVGVTAAPLRESSLRSETSRLFA